jgi:hypothetical protein
MQTHMYVSIVRNRRHWFTASEIFVPSDVGGCGAVGTAPLKRLPLLRERQSPR